ncbi:MAG: hypothetical protein Q8N30_05740 [Methylococcales bacterium]|jgi:hypothetical protein|nr:hypothetical protein [Methylococcales bacterium]
MSYKASLIKMAINLTPNKMIVWVANIVLKGIAELTDFNFDLDTRKVYAQTMLYGETEAIEVWVDGFGIIREGESYQFIIHQAQSNKLWLNNILAKLVGKAWKIPAIPQLAAYMELIAELLNDENPAK